MDRQKIKMKIWDIQDIGKNNIIHESNITIKIYHYLSSIRNGDTMFWIGDFVSRDKKKSKELHMWSVASLSTIHLEVIILERKQNLPAR